ncbi:MAG: cell division protein FtsQ, partial [Pseudomonas sp.]|nr:cell division protein FtsQ [Pseudomonas sp.]
MTATLRHQPGSNRAPVRGKPAQRGASRLVAKEPISLRVSLPKTNFAWLKRLTWPLLLLGLGYGTYELSLRALPYADQPIARISV